MAAKRTHPATGTRRILAECIAGQRDAVRTVERLLAMLNKDDVVDALDRMNRRRILQLLD
jgi:hypothetical protein